MSNKDPVAKFLAAFENQNTSPKDFLEFAQAIRHTDKGVDMYSPFTALLYSKLEDEKIVPALDLLLRKCPGSMGLPQVFNQHYVESKNIWSILFSSNEKIQMLEKTDYFKGMRPEEMAIKILSEKFQTSQRINFDGIDKYIRFMDHDLLKRVLSRSSELKKFSPDNWYNGLRAGDEEFPSFFENFRRGGFDFNAIEKVDNHKDHFAKSMAAIALETSDVAVFEGLMNAGIRPGETHAITKKLKPLTFLQLIDQALKDPPYMQDAHEALKMLKEGMVSQHSANKAQDVLNELLPTLQSGAQRSPS